ncbi:hypothetical protein BJX70DRAFT_372966 [Aspergillus crustosus]
MSGRCAHCSGRGSVRCSHCNGSARVYSGCNNCQNAGNYWFGNTLVRCPVCSGRGHGKRAVNCGNCYSGMVRCPAC